VCHAPVLVQQANDLFILQLIQYTALYCINRLNIYVQLSKQIKKVNKSLACWTKKGAWHTLVIPYFVKYCLGDCQFMSRTATHQQALTDAQT